MSTSSLVQPGLTSRGQRLLGRRTWQIGLATSTVLLTSVLIASANTRESLLAVLLLPGLLPTLVLTILAPILTSHVIASTRDAFIEKGFAGRDLLKGSSDLVPESAGLPTSILYLLLLCLFVPFRYGTAAGRGGSVLSSAASASRPIPVTGDEVWEAWELARSSAPDGGWSGAMKGRRGFPHHELATYLSSLLSILSSVMLGFLDDVFDIRWRLKMPIPILASLPMLVVYRAGRGGTSVVVPGWPSFLREAFGSNTVNLGPIYYVFILLLSTFCVHSINILAGINGVEVGQALVIALSLCVNDILYLDPRAGEPGSYASVELRDRHLFSLGLLLPFCGCCIGLLAWNRYPSLVFVGDTFCYFAGQVLACAGVLGHFSKTLLLFFVPQLFNFALSLLQLAHLVPCPRHRVPDVDLQTMRLHPSVAAFPIDKPARPITIAVLRLFAAFRFVSLEWEDEESSKNGVEDKVQEKNIKGLQLEKSRKQVPRLASTTNLTILNALLVLRGVETLKSAAGLRVVSSSGSPLLEVKEGRRLRGPAITELGLFWHVMLVQIACSAAAFGVRYWLAAVVFP